MADVTRTIHLKVSTWDPVAQTMIPVPNAKVLVEDSGDREARDTAMYGAWLCGTVLGGVGMSVHHKLCHTLGGMLDLPHADTHAILLPHSVAFVYFQY